MFDGPPAELADLVADNPNAKVRRRTFGKQRKRDIHIVCNYADTRPKPACKAPAGAVTGVACKQEPAGATGSRIIRRSRRQAS